jgi:hypothetical protein
MNTEYDSQLAGTMAARRPGSIYHEEEYEIFDSPTASHSSFVGSKMGRSIGPTAHAGESIPQRYDNEAPEFQRVSVI